MTIERAMTQIVLKPWGSADLRPWSTLQYKDATIGELWYQRNDAHAPKTALQFKLLFTTKPLSIQVHPDDALAQYMGLANGKIEAWYILAAQPGAQIAIGLKHEMSIDQLRVAIETGAIVDLVRWYDVVPGDVIFVPAGAIHAIGAGIVLAEIQQNCDTTFRLFDYGRQRDLHIDSALTAAKPVPVLGPAKPQRLTQARSLLVQSKPFILEYVHLDAGSNWQLNASGETWLLVIKGSAQIGDASAALGEALFIDSERSRISPGPEGLTALLAYIGPDLQPAILKNLAGARPGLRPRAKAATPAFHQPPSGPVFHSGGIRT